MIAELAERRLAGEDPKTLALAFHVWMADAVRMGCRAAREKTGLRDVCLTGGVMQNSLLLQLAGEALESEGFRVLTHRLCPANDGGIALGQAYYAMSRALPEA